MLVEVETCIDVHERLALLRLLPIDFAPAAVWTRGSAGKRGEDVVREQERLCDKLTARDEVVFEWLQLHVMPLLPSGAEILRTHYDLLRYRPGGFFAPHVDFSPLAATGVDVCQALLCLSAAPCGGGETAFFEQVGAASGEAAPAERRISLASKTPGGLLVLAGGVRHEGCLVTSGEKLVLKFDVVAPRLAEAIKLRCVDGALRCGIVLLQRSSYLSSLLNFARRVEGAHTAVLDMTVRELAAVCNHLAGLGNPTPQLHARLAYMAEADATVLTAEELALMHHKSCLRTEDGDAARRWLGLAHHPDFAFLNVICWAIYDEEDFAFLNASPLCCVALGPSGQPLMGWTEEEELPSVLGTGGSVRERASGASSEAALVRDPEEVADQFILRCLKEQEERGDRGGFPLGTLSAAAGAHQALDQPYLSLHATAAKTLIDLAHRSPLLGRPDGQFADARKWLTLTRHVVEDYCNDGDGEAITAYHHVGFFSEWWLLKR